MYEPVAVLRMLENIRPDGDAMGHMQFGGRPFLELLDTRVRDRLMQASRHVHYRAGQVVVREGDVGREVYVLATGRCEVIVHGDAVNQIGPNEMFGEIGALCDGGRTATVRAVEDVEVLEISAHQLRSLLENMPAVLDGFLELLASQTRIISNREAVVRDEQRELRAVEESLLPAPELFADSALLSMEAAWRPLTYASGDYCDAVRLGAERYVVAIGDVMGHGAKTSVTLATVRSELRALAEQGRGPGEIIGQLDRHLARHGPRHMPITLAVAFFDGASHVVRSSNAGHVQPLLYRGGAVARLGSVRGPLLGYGLGAAHEYDEDRIALHTGDRILFYTDGLSEARKGPDPLTDMLRAEGLEDMFKDICSNRSTGIVESLLLAVEGFRRGYPAQDDVAALLVKVK